MGEFNDIGEMDYLDCIVNKMDKQTNAIFDQLAHEKNMRITHRRR